MKIRGSSRTKRTIFLLPQRENEAEQLKSETNMPKKSIQIEKNLSVSLEKLINQTQAKDMQTDIYNTEIKDIVLKNPSNNQNLNLQYERINKSTRVCL